MVVTGDGRKDSAWDVPVWSLIPYAASLAIESVSVDAQNVPSLNATCIRGVDGDMRQLTMQQNGVEFNREPSEYYLRSEMLLEMRCLIADIVLLGEFVRAKIRQSDHALQIM